MILTSGRVATTLHETVGHVELVVEVGGEMMCFSSYMETGAVLNKLKAVCDQNDTNGEHYIALRLVKPLKQVQKQLIPGLITVMLAQNARWKSEAILRRQAFFQRFHVPVAVQNLVNNKFPITGYDWAGLFTGRLAEDHWECTGACLGLLHRIGVKTNEYGTGLLGLGTGLLDPIMPVRFLSDKHFQLLTTADQQAYTSSDACQPA